MSQSLPRRDFVKAVAIGSLVITVTASGCRKISDEARAPSAPAGEPFEPVVYVRLDPTGTVTIVCPRSEMGQGIRTTIAMIVADEMEADWKDVKVVQAPGDEKKYGSQNTDGSTSIRDFLPKYREAGATVRALLEAAAAKAWNVPVAEVTAENGRVVHAASKRSLRFGELVSTASHPADSASVESRPQEALAVPLHRQGCAQRGPPGHDYGPGNVRAGPAPRRDEIRGGSAAAGVRGQGRHRRFERGRKGAWCRTHCAAAGSEASDRLSGAGRRRRGGEQHLGGDAGPQEAQDHVGRRSQREL